MNDDDNDNDVFVIDIAEIGTSFSQYGFSTLQLCVLLNLGFF